MATLTIEGNAEQIVSAINDLASTRAIARRKNKERQERVIGRRKIVHRALMEARKRRDHENIDRFAGALGGRHDLDEAIFELALTY